MVEGGGRLHTQFLVEDLVDELQLVVAPFFVGESSAPRFVQAGRFPWTATRRARLAETRRIEDVVLLRYALSDRFQDADSCLTEGPFEEGDPFDGADRLVPVDPLRERTGKAASAGRLLRDRDIRS
jgi:hypothetical protein